MTTDDQSAFPTLAGRLDFGATREAYVANRTAYPDPVYDRLRAYGVGRPGQLLLDVGAGTGLLSRPWLQRGVRVVALDVSPELLDEYREATPDVVLVQARAERHPLADWAFDAVVAGQCRHWFERGRAAVDCLRVLRPGGVIAIVVEATEAIVREANPGWQGGPGHGLYPFWLEDLSSAGFEVLETFSFDVSVAFTHQAWRGRMQASAGVRGSLGPEASAAVDPGSARCSAPDSRRNRSRCLTGSSPPSAEPPAPPMGRRPV